MIHCVQLRALHVAGQPVLYFEWFISDRSVCYDGYRRLSPDGTDLFSSLDETCSTVISLDHDSLNVFELSVADAILLFVVRFWKTLWPPRLTDLRD